jgi:hypothetical protein
MPVVRQCQLNRIQITTPDQIAKIQIRLAVIIAVSLVTQTLGAVAVSLIDITNSHHLHLGFAQKTAHIAGPL